MTNPENLVVQLAALAQQIDQGERDDDPEEGKELARMYLDLDRQLMDEAPIPSRWPRRW